MSSSLRNGRHPTTIPEEARVTTVLLLRRTRELERHLPAALAGNPVAVHRARVASRRLREALPVLVPASRARRKAGRKVRRVTRALGQVRELDVAVGILDELAQRQGIPRDALEDVRGHVVGERDLRRARMVERLTRNRIARLSRRVEEVALTLPPLDLPDWRHSLATRLGHRATRLAAAVAAAGQMYAPESLHNVRIAAKKLRYALELAVDAGLPGKALLPTLKRAQNTLGRLHDLQIIQGHLASVQARPPVRAGVRGEEFALIGRVLEKECRHLHARYIKAVPALLDLAGECRGTVFASPAGAAGRQGPAMRQSPVKRNTTPKGRDRGLGARRA